MSRMINKIMTLEESPYYELGYRSADRNEPRYQPYLTGIDREAWLFGFDTRKHEGKSL